MLEEMNTRPTHYGLIDGMQILHKSLTAILSVKTHVNIIYTKKQSLMPYLCISYIDYTC